MTYDAREKSEQSGAPVELYEFARNAVVWRYTSSEKNWTVEGNLYTSAAISRSAIGLNSERERNALTLTVPRNFPIAELFRVDPPDDVISLTVRRFHRSDSEIAVIWKGAVLNADWSGAPAKLKCEPMTVALERTGPSRLCQISCPHVLYGRGCTLNKADFKIDTTVTAIDGVVITLAALGAYTSYGGGFVEKIDGDGNFQRRFIESNDGLDLTLSRQFQDLAPTDSVTAYPGCDHSLAICDSDFDNVPNYGGMPYMSRKNPFGSDPIF